MKRTIIAAALALAVVAPAHADITGSVLLDRCTSSVATLTGFCNGYVFGVAEAHPTICAPAGATTGQAVDMVVKALREVPEVRHLPASAIVAATLESAGWTCKAPEQAPRKPTTRSM